jgi:hypothetical protein
VDHHIAAMIATDNVNIMPLVNMIRTVWRAYLEIENGPDSAMHDPAMELIHHVAHNRPQGVRVEVKVTTGKRNARGRWELLVRKIKPEVSN